jgi:hypothetical protein
MQAQSNKTWTTWLAMDEIKTLRVDDLELPPNPTAQRLYTALSIYMADPDDAVHVKVQCPESQTSMLVCGTPYRHTEYNLPRNSWLPSCMGPVAVIGAGLTATGKLTLTDIGQGSALFALEAAQQIHPNQITVHPVWVYGVDSVATTPTLQEAHLQSAESLTAQCRRWLGATPHETLGRIPIKSRGLTPMTILGRMYGTANPNPRAPGLVGAVAILGGRLDTATEPPTWELQEITQEEITQHLVYLQQHHLTDTTLQPILHTE